MFNKGNEPDYYVIMGFREGMDGVNSYHMLQNLPGSFRMKMGRSSALKILSECLDIKKGGTAGFRSLGDWSSGFHPFVFVFQKFLKQVIQYLLGGNYGREENGRGDYRNGRGFRPVVHRRSIEGRAY